MLLSKIGGKGNKRLTNYVDLDITGPGVLEETNLTNLLDYPQLVNSMILENLWPYPRQNNCSFNIFLGFFFIEPSFSELAQIFWLLECVDFKPRLIPINKHYFRIQGMSEMSCVGIMNLYLMTWEKRFPASYRKQFVKEPSGRYLHLKHEFSLELRRTPYKLTVLVDYSF